MTFEELSSYFETFGVTRAEVLPILSNCDLGDEEKMRVAKAALDNLKVKARQGFRQVAAPLHPDKNPDPAAHKKYNEYARVMQIIKGLTVGALHGLYDAVFAQHTEHYADAPVDYMGRHFEDAQTESFLAMAKYYKGPMVPLGWMGNRAPPPPSGSPGRTFTRELPVAVPLEVDGGLVDINPRTGGPSRRRR